jgi:hypothetical protein
MDYLDFDLKGKIKMVTKDMEGNILETHEQNNMIVRNIRPIIVQLLAQTGYSNVGTLPSITSIRFGDSSAPAAVNDPTLRGSVLITKAIIGSGALSDSNRKATFSVLISDNDAPGASICEAGLFAGDTMIARTTFGTYTKAAGTYFEFYWTIGYDA